MISDVLFDAVHEMRRYLDDPVFAGCYAGDERRRIEKLITDMETMRVELDRLPPR